MEFEENNNLLTLDPSGIDISGNGKLILDSNGNIYANDISINSLELNGIILPNLKTGSDKQILVKDGTSIVWKDNKADELGTHQTEFNITIGRKTSNHPNYGNGSDKAFYIDNIEAPILYFKPNHTYRFILTDTTNRGYPLIFYKDNNRGRVLTTNSTGIPGFSNSLIQITINEDTPTKIYYDTNPTNLNTHMGNYCSIEISIDNVTNNELKFLNGITSNVQTQITNAALTSTGTKVIANNGSGNAAPLTKIDIDGISYPISGGGGTSQWTNGSSNNIIYYNSGNVGIGTDAPSKTLDISGSLNVSNGVIVTNGIRLTGNNLGTTTNTLKWDNSGNKIFYNTDNVGIGVSDPTEKLEVNGTIKASNMQIGNIDVATKSFVNVGLLAKQNIINEGELNISHINGLDISLNNKASLLDPSFSGIPKAPTASSTNNTTQLATTAFVKTAINELVGGGPDVINIINDLSAALIDNSYSTAITSSLTEKVTKTTNETISGNKTFTGDSVFNNINFTGTLTKNGITFSTGAIEISDLSDVDTHTNSPLNGQALVWNDTDSTWKPGTAGATQLSSLDDVNLYTNPPTDGQTIIWDNSNAIWKPGAASTNKVIGEFKLISSSRTDESIWGHFKFERKIASIDYGAIGFDQGSSSSDNIEEALCINRVGRIGIGTNNPEGGLHVANYLDRGMTQIGDYFMNANDWNHSSGSWMYGSNINGRIYVGIRCNYGIWCKQLNYDSDTRIKTDISLVQDDKALKQINDLDTYEYNYIDPKLKRPLKTVGFLAQEVNKILPNAVNIHNNFIPDEMQVIKNPVFTEFIDISNNKKFKLIINNLDLSNNNTGKCKFYVTNDISNNVEICKEINVEQDNKTFIFDESWNNVFLYGKEVNDYLTLNKDMIFALHHSGIQELSRENEKIKEENEKIKEENLNLKQSISDILERLEKIECKSCSN